MGAWNFTAFGNDDAADFSGALQGAKHPVALLKKTFARAAVQDYLEALDGSQIVAAASVVAADCNEDPQGLPEDVAAWVATRNGKLKSLAPIALTAIQRVTSEDSELCELWQDSEDFEQWLETVESIGRTLESVN